MRFDLATLAKRARPGTRKQSIVIREVSAPTMLAQDLFASVYRPVIDLWAAAAPGIAAEYARTLAEMTTDAATCNDSLQVRDAPTEVQTQIDGAEAAFQRLFFALTPSLRDWVLRVESSVRQRWARQVYSATSVDLSSLLGPADVRETLESIMARNAALVKDVSQQIQSRISDAVFRGLNARSPARDVAKEINEAVALGRKRALRVAQDQLSKASGALAEERQRQAGIDQVIWSSSHKLRPRPHHAARDGKRYYLETKKAVDGSETVAPGDWVSQPPFCGCRTRAYISFDDE